MNPLTIGAIIIGALVAIYAAYLVWVGMNIAEEDNEDHR